MGIDKATAKILYKNRLEIVLGIGNGNWDTVNIPKKAEFWAKMLSSIAIKQSDSIDKNVSTDVHKLLRLPGTIHGDTGLIAKRLSSVSDLSNFDPMSDAVAFKGGSRKVRVDSAPQFEIAGRELRALLEGRRRTRYRRGGLPYTQTFRYPAVEDSF